jgi:hypothetical protein
MTAPSAITIGDSLYNNDRDNNQQLSYRWKRKEMLGTKKEEFKGKLN